MSPATPTHEKEATMTQSDADRPTASDLSLLLSRYSAWLLGAGATCIRLEMNVRRIAKAYGREVELTITPRHVHISLWKEGETEVLTSIATVNHNVTSFNTNTRLSELSWEIADGRIGFAEAQRRFCRIVHSDNQDRRLVLLLVSLANASFCRLFGGDWMAMAVVAVATFAGYCLKLLLLGRGVDVRAVMIACSFVSAVLGATDQLFSLGSTPAIALGTSVLYLVPGIPFINSFSDILYRHYLCALSRFADAAVLTCCLSIGLCAGMLLMGVGMF